MESNILVKKFAKSAVDGDSVITVKYAETVTHFDAKMNANLDFATYFSYLMNLWNHLSRLRQHGDKTKPEIKTQTMQ